MITLTAKTTGQIHAKSARITANTLRVRLDDGREVSVPFTEVSWLKWLAKATPKPCEISASTCEVLDSQPIA